MAAITILVVKLASGGLLRIQSQFRIALAALHVATAEAIKNRAARMREPRSKPTADQQSDVMIPFVSSRAVLAIGNWQ